MTLGAAAAFQVRLIVWCKACQHQVEPEAAEMAERYCADTSVLDWCKRLVCSGANGPAGSDCRRETFGRLRHLRQIGPAPHLSAPESGRKPEKFHSAV
jgi:hypothetical protein